MNTARSVSTLTALTVAIAVVIICVIVWTLGVSGVIHLPRPLVWILPFICLLIAVLALLWDKGTFESR